MRMPNGLFKFPDSALEKEIVQADKEPSSIWGDGDQAAFELKPRAFRVRGCHIWPRNNRLCQKGK